ncbi:DUF4381 domain-containing protein [Pseudohongiella sp.]|uniref:DUF4381 domain-containing protein n=1 Tax=marine sediment metagenome TaxID=412755 RepID=A0A0F9W608_9ZZZZ|nr:DUF4381 domain-containing protein [Pseudohongiella sp.]HDZ09040.1 DUF4381 domain-containing protein [Pseudohongiella sp.]HEA62725.1 DUF4381 domain-containing protein [Pseudohongiella sp.]
MDFADALSDMADIHLPAEPGFWPLAPGWWVLAALLLALLVYGAYRLQQRLQLHRRYRSALRELDKCLATLQANAGTDGPDMEQRLVYVNEVNSVLRRVALSHFEHNRVAGLSGQDWVAFIKQHDRAGRLTPELASALAEGRFAPRCDVDTGALHGMARDWIKNLYMAKIKPDATPETAPESSPRTKPTADHHA